MIALHHSYIIINKWNIYGTKGAPFGGYEQWQWHSKWANYPYKQWYKLIFYGTNNIKPKKKYGAIILYAFYCAYVCAMCALSMPYGLTIPSNIF